MVKKSFFIFTLILSLFLTPIINAQTTQTDNLSNSNNTRETINTKDYNVLIFSDERILVMMAALTLAGYNYEGTGKLAEFQKDLRQDLKDTPPAMVKKLREFYSAHQIPGREDAVQISPYIGLALSLSAVPALSNPQVKANLPFDVQEILGFGNLVREFYSRSQVRNFLPKYKAILDSLRNDYENTANDVLYETLVYLRTKPVLFLPPTPVLAREYDSYVMPNTVVIKKDKKDDKKDGKEGEESKDKIIYVPRVRRLQIFPNPLAPPGAIFSRNDILNGADQESRRLGDDYFIVASEQSIKEHIRHAFLRFVLDPVVGKRSVEIANLKEQIDPLVLAQPNAKERAKRNVFEVVGESLARAVGVRLTARAGGKNFSADEAAYLLSQYYEQGFVLTFHFYETLLDLERAGLDISDFFPAMLKSIDFARETKRLEDTRLARSRIEQRQAEVKTIIDLDTLIKERKFTEAQTQISAMLREQPKNARALFGMAQIVNSQPSNIETDDISSDDDKIAAQEERLSRAVKIYREAIAAASNDEKWLVSQCHLLIGRIYDFVEEREAALKEYDKAIELGDVPKGAYKEALAAKNKPPASNKDDE